MKIHAITPASWCWVALADKLGADISEKKHKALCGRVGDRRAEGDPFKPQTYMNSSGESIRAAADYYKVCTLGHPGGL